MAISRSSLREFISLINTNSYCIKIKRVWYYQKALIILQKDGKFSFKIIFKKKILQMLLKLLITNF